MKYHQAVEKFQAYCRRRRLCNSTVALADKHMAEYTTDLYEDGEPHNTASYALYGYLLFKVDESSPDKDLFPHTRGALKGWNSRSPQGSRAGADPLIWYRIAEVIAASNPPAAAALLLQLDSYARPSEILSLIRSDIVRPSSKQCRFWGLIFGNSSQDAVTKTGSQDDTVLLDSRDREYAPCVLSWVIKHSKQPGDFLFPQLTLGQYESLFRSAKKVIGLGRFDLTPHAVRHTGPSIDFLNKSRTATEIQSRGRWRCLESVLRYQKPGQMLASMSRIPQQVWDDSQHALTRVLPILQKFYGSSRR